MFKTALKSLLGHKLRMLLTTISIVIGVSFISGTYIFTDSMNKTFTGLFDDVYSSIDVLIRAEESDLGSTEVEITPELLAQVQATDGVEVAIGEANGTAIIFDNELEIIGPPGPPKRGGSWTDISNLNPFSINEGNGRSPVAAGEVVIDKNSAELGEFSLGDTISIQADGPVEEFELVGIASFGSADTLAGATISGFELSEAQRLFSLGENFSQVSVLAEEGVDSQTLRDSVSPIVPDGLKAFTGDQEAASQIEDINEGLGFINTALLAFAGIAIFVGSFIIQNTFRIIVSQRSKELALLRAIGAVRKQVIALVVYEAIFIAIFASALGILAGVGLSKGLQAIANLAGLAIPDGELTLLPRTIVVGMLVGVVVTAMSALLPAIKASRVSPVEALSDHEAGVARKSLKSRALYGFGLSVAGGVLLFVGLFMSVTNPIYYVGFGALVVFLGVSTLAPLLSKPFAQVIGIPVKWAYGLIGRMAQLNSMRSPRRTASTAAALMIGVSLVVMVTVFSSSVKSTIDQVFEESFPGDITITSQLFSGDGFEGLIPEKLSTDLEAIDATSEVSRLKYDLALIDDSTKLIIAVDPETIDSVISLTPSGGSFEDLGVNEIYIRENTLEDLEKQVGDTIEITYPSLASKTLEITGSFEDAMDSPFLISNETYSQNYSNTSDFLVVTNFAEGVDEAAAKTAVNQVVDQYPVLQAQDQGELVEDARTQIDQFLGLMTALLGFAVIIAVLGITNTLTLSVAERTREIGMLRAVGMTRKQVRKMIRGEAIIIAVFGAVLGLLIGVFFGWAILKALEDEGLTSFSVPIVQMLFYLVLSALAGFFAALIPAFKASRMNILDAISYE